MNRSHPATPAAIRAGFTLIELLVVISIIAVISAILLPVYSRVQNAAQKVKAVNDMRNIKVAILAYFGDYQKYPVDATIPTQQDILFGDIGGNQSSADLFDPLRALDIGSHHYNQNDKLNPTKTVYWVGQNATSLTQPRSGISLKTIQGKTAAGRPADIPVGSFMDPWGQPYIVYMDLNQDGDLSDTAGISYGNSKFKTGDVRTGQRPNGLEFVSMGPDGVFGKKTSASPNGDGILAGSDDIATWVH